MGDLQKIYTDVKVSVIIPVYNMEKYLVSCIESVINQTLKDIEIIFINDGSADKSLEILRMYEARDSRVKVYSKTNSGYGHTINYGLDRCHGKYVVIVESDDFIDAGGIELLYQCAERNKADYVRADYYEFGETEKINQSLKAYQYNKVFSALEDLSIFYSISISPWACIYNKDFLDSNNIRMNQTPGASFQDNSWRFMILLQARRIVFLKEAFYHYRINNMESSINNVKKVFCVVNEKDYMDKKLYEYNIKKSDIFRAYARLIYNLYKWNYERISAEFQYAFLVEWKKEIEVQRGNGYLYSDFFEKEQWDEINQIAAETDRYFEETAKTYRMNKVYEYTMNGVMYYNAFLEKLSHNELMVFGTGIIAKRLMCLMEEEGILENVLCFCETKPTKKYFFSKPVFPVKDIPYPKETLLICAITERIQKDIIEELKDIGFTNVLCIDKSLNKMGVNL